MYEPKAKHTRCKLHRVCLALGLSYDLYMYSSGQSKVYVAFAFNDRLTIKSFRVKRNVTKTLTPKQNGVETVKKRRVTERETAATVALRRATNAQ